ncbi:hypothetical protein ACT0K6_000151 [Enterococcus faecalis]|uniref:hypothetical protein n=1 Tax=Enterococcus faecalis TaxID=1351 RepID=UPI000CF01D61|nr:hypothetical protein [Enterococcus faecalis]MBO6372952.1 hypothetical protein [Enterococcus faecalis]MCO5486724.1 hypothetical protein [Enterococcus faecalis]MDN3096604.1 hypothetical protein [Enterococcus faecalis]PQD11467.1 hypothetical protein CUM65_03985 [Enterococcus faecalis]PQG36868.1 hypothetical protein CUS34_11600 [Enterococcus faecalis]
MKKSILKEFKATKNKGEDFLHWLLVRKLNTFGKVVIALILWILWLKYAFNLVFMVNFLKVVVLITIVYWLIEFFLWVKEKLGK